MSSLCNSNGDAASQGETWGCLAPYQHYGRVGDKKEDYPELSYDDAKTNYTTQTHASHVMLYARHDQTLWDLYKARAAVMMQMRFDGLIGFPGGIVDPGEDPVAGLNRELEEEIHLNMNKYKLTDLDHLVTYYCEPKNLVLHFFVKEVTLEEFKELEVNALKAPEHSIETLGSIRPPLFTMGDNFRGFPAFLTNNFAGNAKEELLHGLSKLNIMTQEEIQKALSAAEDYFAKRYR